MASSVVNSRVSGGGAKEVVGVVAVVEEEAEEAEEAEEEDEEEDEEDDEDGGVDFLAGCARTLKG